MTKVYREESLVPGRPERIAAQWVRSHPPNLTALIQGKQGVFTLEPSLQWLKNADFQENFAEEAKRRAQGRDGLPPAFALENYDLVSGWSGAVRSNGFGVGAAGYLLLRPNSAPQKNGLLPSDGQKEINEVANNLQFLPAFSIHFGRPRNRYEGDEYQIDFADKTVPAAFPLLGAEALNWWKNENKITEETLKRADVAPENVPTSQTLPVSDYDRLHSTSAQDRQADMISLSDALQGWTAHTKTEAIMELHPRTELWETQGLFFNPDEPAAKNAPFLPLSAWIFNPQHAHQWSVREQNRVLLIVSQMEFVERPQNAPLPELLQLRDDMDKWQAQHPLPPVPNYGTAYEPYEPLAAYTRAVLNRRDGRTWGAVPTLAGYHGFTFHDLDSTVAALFLWNKLSKKEQTRLLLPPPGANAETAYTTSVPMSYFGEAALATLLELYREQNRSSPADTMGLQWINELRASVFEISINYVSDASQRTPGCYAVGMGIPSAAFTWGMPPNVGARVYLLIPSANASNP